MHINFDWPMIPQWLAYLSLGINLGLALLAGLLYFALGHLADLLNPWNR